MPGYNMLEDDFKNFKDIKFVSIEVIRNDLDFEKADKIDCGLFLGVLEKETDNIDNSKFVGVITSASTIKLFNVTEYNILSINVLNDVTRHTVIYGSNDGDQKQALEDLAAVTTALKKEERICKEDPREEIIDTDSYEDYENEVFDEVEINTSVTNTTNNNKSTTSSTTSNTTNSYTKPVDNTPKVFKIRRKGKMPSFERIDAMKQKIKNLAGIEVKVPVLKCDLEENKEKEVETTLDNSEINDYYDRMYGAM